MMFLNTTSKLAIDQITISVLSVIIDSFGRLRSCLYRHHCVDYNFANYKIFLDRAIIFTGPMVEIYHAHHHRQDRLFYFKFTEYCFFCFVHRLQYEASFNETCLMQLIAFQRT